jgi:CRP/FNR family transcriptional regulator, cyclic AMP receptor protein
LIHTPFFQRLGRAGIWCPFKRRRRSSLKAILGTAYSLSKPARCGSVWCRKTGREATLGILGEGDFFGEGGLAGQPLRMSSATALTDCVLLHVERKAMVHAMSLEPKLSAMFVKYLLKRNIRYQDDLVDQLFNSSEKRLARTLLLMANFGKEGVSEMSIPRLSQETLAEMVGTTRSRVSFFMNRFRKLGFIHYDVGDNVRVRSSLLNVVLHDDDGNTATPGVKNPKHRANKSSEPPPEQSRCKIRSCWLCRSLVDAAAGSRSIAAVAFPY